MCLHYKYQIFFPWKIVVSIRRGLSKFRISYLLPLFQSLIDCFLNYICEKQFLVKKIQDTEVQFFSL